MPRSSFSSCSLWSQARATESASAALARRCLCLPCDRAARLCGTAASQRERAARARRLARAVSSRRCTSSRSSTRSTPPYKWARRRNWVARTATQRLRTHSPSLLAPRTWQQLGAQPRLGQRPRGAEIGTPRARCPEACRARAYAPPLSARAREAQRAGALLGVLAEDAHQATVASSQQRRHIHGVALSQIALAITEQARSRAALCRGSTLFARAAYRWHRSRRPAGRIRLKARYARSLSAAERLECLSRVRLGAMSGGVQLASVKGERAPSESEHSSLLHHRAGPGYDGTVGASGRGWSEAGAAPPPDRDGVSHRCGRSYAWKPFVLASIAIGAGSFAQGCAERRVELTSADRSLAPLPTQLRRDGHWLPAHNPLRRLRAGALRPRGAVPDRLRGSRGCRVTPCR